MYAFALLAWGVLTRRTEPWAGLAMPAIMIPSCVRAGERPGDGIDWAAAWRARGGSAAVTEMVLTCWQTEPARRLSFAAIAGQLDRLLDSGLDTRS